MENSNIIQIEEMLFAKEKLFLQYEKTTHHLLECDADSAEHYIIQRSDLANGIDEITQQIGAICNQAENGDLLLNASFARVSFQQLPKEMLPIYTLAQQIQSIVFRISGMDEQVLNRLQNFQQEASEKIRTNQHLPKIKKYLTDLTDQPAHTNLTSGKA